MSGVSDPASLKRELLSRVDRARASLSELLAVQGPRTVENTLQPYDDLFGQLWTAAGAAVAIESLHPDSAMREAVNEVRPSFQGLMAEVELRRDVYEALASIAPASIPDDLTKRYLRRELEYVRRRGIDRPEVVRARLRQLRTELNLAQAEFQRNIRNGNRQLETTAAELEGVPRDFVARRSQGPNGAITLTTDAIDMRMVLE